MTDRILIAWDEGLAEQELRTEDVSEVLSRVDALDGRSRTLVTVYRGDAHAAAGGSAASGLVLYVTFDGAVFHQLQAADCTDGDKVVVVAGGQAGNYPRQSVVTGNTARRAMRTFFEEGVLDPELRWETT